MLKSSITNAVSELKRIISTPLGASMTISGLVTSLLAYSDEAYKGNNPAIFPYVIGGLVSLMIVAYIFSEPN